MATYYEMLKLTPSASKAEIQAAYDTQYNQWRRLVTHHDPDVVNQANQALQTLEKILSTLSDPVRRAAYDEGIGVGGAVGGLADPAALLQTLAVPPMSTSSSQAVSTSTAPKRLWACYKCNSENPPQTKFCLNCTAQLVRTCPECDAEASLVATGVCGKCGYGYHLASHRSNLRRQREEIQREISSAEGAIQATKNIRSFWLGLMEDMWLLLLIVGVGFIWGLNNLFYTPWAFLGIAAGIVTVVLIIMGSRSTSRDATIARDRAHGKPEQVKRLKEDIQLIDAELATNVPNRDEN